MTDTTRRAFLGLMLAAVPALPVVFSRNSVLPALEAATDSSSSGYRAFTRPGELSHYMLVQWGFDRRLKRRPLMRLSPEAITLGPRSKITSPVCFVDGVRNVQTQDGYWLAVGV